MRALLLLAFISSCGAPDIAGVHKIVHNDSIYFGADTGQSGTIDSASFAHWSGVTSVSSGDGVVDTTRPGITVCDTTMLYPGDKVISHELFANANGYRWVDSAREIKYIYYPMDSGFVGHSVGWMRVHMIQVSHKGPMVFVFTSGEAMWGKHVDIKWVVRKNGK